MVVDEHTKAGEVIIGTTYACEGCASVALVLSPVGHGGLLGSALGSLFAAGWFFLGKEQEHGWIAGTFAMGLAAFFRLLSYLRQRDARQNPRF